VEKRREERVIPMLKLSTLQEHLRIGRESGSLQYEQVKLLYSNLPVSLIISVMLALILVTVQVSVITPERLV
jgi:hypothetical protein